MNRKMFVFIVTMLLTALVTSVSTAHKEDNHHYHRYSPNPQDHQPQSTTLRIPRPYTPESESPFLPDDNDDSEIISAHTPLGDVCADISYYCTFFANNFKNHPLYERNAQQLFLLQNILSLLTNLADHDTKQIRCESFLSDVAHIASSLRAAIDQHAIIPEKYPLLAAFNEHFSDISGPIAAEEMSTEIGMLIYYILRSPLVARPLVHEVMLEVSTFTQEKTVSLITSFEKDATTLLEFASTTEDLVTRTTSPLCNQDDLQLMQRMAWFSHYAANACGNLIENLPSSELLAHAQPLAQQVQALLTAMSLTYDHLTNPQQIRHVFDRDTLASHFALMLDLMPKTLPHSRTTPSHIIATCMELRTIEEKEAFIAILFDNYEQREAFLREFFALFKKSLVYNLENFSNSLTAATINVLQQKLWPANTESY